MAAKKNKMAMISTIIGAISNIIISFVLVPSIGVYGALIASVISFFIITITRILTTRKYVIISVNWYRIGICLGLILLQSIILTINRIYSIHITIGLMILIIFINLSAVFEALKYVFRRKGSFKNTV